MSKSSGEAKAKNGSGVHADDRKRYRELFETLDVNKDGRIEVSELSQALKQRHVPEREAQGHAQLIMAEADSDTDKQLDFSEFVRYMAEHERQLKLTFAKLDRNKDGQIEPSEVQAAMSQLGIDVSLEEAKQLTQRLDKDGDLSVGWEEWREFLQLYPETDLEKIVKFWRQSLMIDIGDLITVPPEFTKKEKETGMWWRYLVAGAMAGAVSRTFTAPLDRVKIMLQVHGSKQNVGIIGGLRQMIHEGGIKSLWRGNGTNVLKIAPESAMKFGAYEQIKILVKGDKKEIGVVERFAAGSMAGAVAQTTIYPLEVIKTRLAVSKTGQYKGILDCGLKIYQREGAKALFKGYLPNIIGIIPYAGIDLSIYETLKQFYLRQHPEEKDPGVMILLACGTMSSTCGQLASYPLALVRTRLQAGAVVDGRSGMVTLAKSIIKDEGPRGLYRGIAPNFLKVLPAVSISYVIYERAKGFLGIQQK